MGFFRRYTGNLAALCTIFVVISASLVVHASLMIKTDLPPALFLVAHYFALIEMLNRRSNPGQHPQRWALLAGILCGGAVGLKLIMLPAALFSSLLVLGSDIYYYAKKREQFVPLTLWWFGGMLFVMFPWILRSIVNTGNPLYPFFSSLPIFKLVRPWHATIRGDISIAHYGWGGLKDLVTGPWLTSGTPPSISPPWGPSLMFILISVFLSERRIRGIPSVLGLLC